MLFKGLKPILYGGREVWPLIEGGKGVSATNHASSGAWAAAGGIGTVSAVNADSYDAEGRIIPQIYEALTRRDRHEELIQYAIDGAVAQVQRAYDMASGKGAININALRDTMREQGLADTVPIVMAGGVWRLDEWDNWIDNPELGQIIFQFGTRPLLTQESPIPPEWKARLMNLEEGDILLHRFSPTGFYSSAVRNPFLRNLEARSERQIAYTKESIGDHHFELDVGIGTKRHYLVTKGDLIHAREWYAQGFTNPIKSPDDTLIFVTPEEEKQIRVDQAECMGCLSQCAFSSCADNEKNSTGRLADPRSFCIQKTLQEIAHGC